MKIEIKEIALNSMYLYLVQGLNFLLPLITLPYLLATLSVDSFGKYSFSFAFSQFIIIFVDFGFNLSATKKIAENFTNNKLIKNVFWKISIIKLIFLLLSFTIAIILIYTVDKISYYKEGILVSFIMIFGTALFPIWWFQGLNKMKILSIISASSKLLTYPLIFVFVKESDDSNFAIFFQSLSILLAGLFSYFYLFINFKDYFTNIKLERNYSEYYKEVKEAWPIFLSNSSISLYTNSLTLLLGFFSSSYNVGLFGAMERIVRVVCFGVLGPVNQACFPIIARTKQIDFNKAKRIFKIVLAFITINLILAFLTYLLFENFIILHFMNGYNNIEGMLTTFMFMIFPIAIGGVIGQLGLLGLGDYKHKKIFSKIYLITGLFSVPLSLILINLYEVEGAIISMMSVELIIFLILIYFVKKYKFI
ncbi:MULTISPECIES: oligosaccharide flippase family protein [unclassified Empedobacter]|uniref:oligosaccharide flippase family protein n=1 Tax=unclassified Empedobacter TaxID=2643773 RepID=UPI0025C158E3|nr:MULTISPECIES: oligosaccharide flippase family protein [unclassified Empedobacter]